MNITCQSLNVLDRSITCWKRALEVLPKKNLSPSELKQKEQYQTELKRTQEELAQQKNAASTGFELEQSLAPWQMVDRMMPELIAGGPAMLNSSVSF